ncbi:MAG: sigma 54-interacting transcriptional regulator [Acidobacteria bacterium]|nr:sigma 54-interacting transcriptional regulator [Acidobacteriota bacterium]
MASATLVFEDLSMARILDRFHAGVIATDLEGKITGANQAALRMYGYVGQELLGKTVAFLCPDEEQAFVRDSVIRQVLERGHYLGELRSRTKSGREIDVHLCLVRVGDENSIAAGMAGFLIDIRGQKTAESVAEVAELRQEAGSHTGQVPHEMLPVEREISGTKFLIASPVMHRFMAMADRVALEPEIVLITGETGSGKELIARSIHDNSPRRSGPWVDINCAALPENLVESELFGYEKGAFSGADSSKPGLFELAAKGTLFLDEIGELDPKLQVKLLRVLDGSSYYRLGGHRKITVDVRVVAATNQDLERRVEEGRFRGDLYHRLAQFELRVPPLRERSEDVAALAAHFLALKNSGLAFSPEALRALVSYRWPGNVRQLRNVVVKFAMSANGSEVRAEDLPAEISACAQKNQNTSELPVTNLEGMEEQMIIQALANTGGHRGLAAEQLGISRRTLSRKMRQYNITCRDNERTRAPGFIGVEQQKCFRAKASFELSLKNAEGEETRVTGVNLSTGGLGLEGLTSSARFGGVLDASFVLPESETLIQAKIRIVWIDAAGRAGARFVVLQPAFHQQLRQWTARKMKADAGTEDR